MAQSKVVKSTSHSRALGTESDDLGVTKCHLFQGLGIAHRGFDSLPAHQATIQPNAFTSTHWIPIRDGDPRGRAIYNRHYCARHYKDGRRPKTFVGPGEYMALMTTQCDALWVWRKWTWWKYKEQINQTGINCAVFRNESTIRSSDLIREACELAWTRWPGERLYTYIAPARIASSNPGYCYLMAGWNKCGKTKSGLVIMETLDSDVD